MKEDHSIIQMHTIPLYKISLHQQVLLIKLCIQAAQLQMEGPMLIHLQVNENNNTTYSH